MGQELSPAQQKEMKDYKFWKTQPVPSLSETVTEEGPIDKLKTPEDVPNDPLPLISDFEWSTLDIDDNLQLMNYINYYMIIMLKILMPHLDSNIVMNFPMGFETTGMEKRLACWG